MAKNIITKAELMEYWKRPVEVQYEVAIAKILEAITETKGDITLCYSGGKDSSLNETSNMRRFIKEFIPRCETLYGVKIEFTTVKPANGLVWAKFVKENGIPLISKKQARYISDVKSDMIRLGVDYDTVKRLYKGGKSAVKELKDLGFSQTAILNLTGYVEKRDEFGKAFMISKKWLPMVTCSVDLTNQCCVQIKERPLAKLNYESMMTGEQAAESMAREQTYLQTGCNTRMANGIYKSKPFGAMTQDGILYSCMERELPMCADYGEIVKDEDGHYHCTKSNRTGCALCGFGCQYDTERFVRLAETEPAKVKFAFKPKAEGGAGYKEAIEHMNEYCGTKVKIPEIK